MTKLILETDNAWTKKKIKDAIHTETEILKKLISRVQGKLGQFEGRYGKFDRDSLYGKVDDMELIEWEGELETMIRLKKKLEALEKITFEYR